MTLTEKVNIKVKVIMKYMSSQSIHIQNIESLLIIIIIENKLWKFPAIWYDLNRKSEYQGQGYYEVYVITVYTHTKYRVSTNHYNYWKQIMKTEMFKFNTEVNQTVG